MLNLQKKNDELKKNQADLDNLHLQSLIYE
jgi:hypothetical protein